MLALQTPEITIRALTIQELPLCLGHAEAYYNALEISGNFSPAQFLGTWEHLYTHNTAIVLGLTLEKEEVGGMGIVVAPDQCSTSLIGTTMWVFIDEDARGGSGALQLFRQGEQWAQEQGAEWMRFNYHLTKQLYQYNPVDSAWGRALTAMHYAPMDITWQKCLQPPQGRER